MARVLNPFSRPAIYLVLSCVAVIGYLLLAQIQNGEFGFPLDDAWIHQVYARSLGARGEFAFFHGQPSAGSTSPLWAILLAVGYFLRIDYRVWTVGLSILAMAASAALCVPIARRLGATPRSAIWLVPLFSILEWHLTWAAASGMEIPLFILLSLALLELFQSSTQPFVQGIVAGLLTLTRPEGAALALLVALMLVAKEMRKWGSRRNHPTMGEGGRLPISRLFSTSAGYSAGFALLLLPYITFNLWSSGSPLPNTFYAKSQEYAELLARTNFLERWIDLYRQPLLGAQILLIPGLAWIGWRLARESKWDALVPFAWIAVLPGLYAARLPVDYQYGRYEMPIIPYIGIYGIVGTEMLLMKVRGRIVRRAWGLAVAALVAAFAVLGANQYSRSVAIVNCEMVATARWTAANVPAGALIAAHDIGAQGYFDSHPLLDLAGLVSPEVIPFIRGEGKIADWIKSRGASYAIFFPSWYPQLASDAGFVAVHSENCTVTHEAGEVDLVVYRIVR